MDMLITPICLFSIYTSIKSLCGAAQKIKYNNIVSISFLVFGARILVLSMCMVGCVDYIKITFRGLSR